MMNIIKKWILSRSFVLDSFEEYFKTQKEKIYQQAFIDSRKDLEETNKFDVDGKSDELCKHKLNELLSNVELHKIVSLDKTKGILFIGGVKADEGRLANLKSEAEFLDKSDIWQLIQETPRELAQRAMFVEGESLDNMKKGRSILYTLSTQKNIVEILKGYVGKPKPPATPKKSP